MDWPGYLALEATDQRKFAPPHEIPNTSLVKMVTFEISRVKFDKPIIIANHQNNTIYERRLI